MRENDSAMAGACQRALRCLCPLVDTEITQGAGVLLGFLSFWLQKAWTSAERHAKPRARVPPNTQLCVTMISCRSSAPQVISTNYVYCIDKQKIGTVEAESVEGIGRESQLAHKVYLPPSVSTAWHRGPRRGKCLNFDRRHAHAHQRLPVVLLGPRFPGLPCARPLIHRAHTCAHRAPDDIGLEIRSNDHLQADATAPGASPARPVMPNAPAQLAGGAPPVSTPPRPVPSAVAAPKPPPVLPASGPPASTPPRPAPPSVPAVAEALSADSSALPKIPEPSSGGAEAALKVAEPVSNKSVAAKRPSAPPPAAKKVRLPSAILAKPSAGEGKGDEKSKKASEMDEMMQEVQDIKARTMYNMITEVEDPAGKDKKKMCFLTNRQAGLFHEGNINKIIQAFELPTPKLVIRLMTIGGGTASRQYGMIQAFKNIKRDGNYEEMWKKVLRIQAQNNPSTTQDMLPDPPFLNEKNADTAQWNLESFMRDVVVPLAASNNAIVIGSAFADDEMMTAFAKVAKQLEAKYGGLGGPKPWSLFAFAEATRLIKAAESDTSVTSHFYKASKSWSMQMQKIKQAKKIAEESKRVPRDEDDVGVDKLGGMELGDPYITFDLNPNLNNVIIVDCVLEKHGKIMGIDAGPMAGLRIQLMDHLSSKYALVAFGTMHCLGGYAGLKLAGSWMQLNIPVLLLDVRIQKERPGLPDEVTDFQAPTNEHEANQLYEKLKRCDSKAIETVNTTPGEGEKSIFDKVALALFEIARRHDEAYAQRLMEAGKADIYEVCRLAYFHSLFFQKDSKPQGNERMSLYERILAEEKDLQAASVDVAGKFMNLLQNKVAEWCTIAEFRAYWALKSQDEKDEIFEKEGITDFREVYRKGISDARSAYHAVLSSNLLYTAHVKDTEQLKFLVNNKMMDKDGLPEKNTLEALMVLRQAWDMADIGQHVLKSYKVVGKVAYAALTLLAIAIVTVSVLTPVIDGSGVSLKGKKLSELLTFAFSVLTSFVTALMAFVNPVLRWKNLRHNVASLESIIWLFRTRTGDFPYKPGMEGKTTQKLREQVLKVRDEIMQSADIQDTAFYKVYPAEIFKHNQRPKKASGNKIEPEPSGDKDKVLYCHVP